MTRDALRRLASPLAWTLYIALPVGGWGWLNGLPIGWLEAGAIALVWWVWAGGRRLPGMRALAALTAAKLVVGMLLVPGGFAARYYANDTWSPPVERSLEFRRGDITRRDERLAFGGDGQLDLPLHFLNHLRFNFYQPTEPRRDQLAYSVVWEGWIAGDGTARRHTFYLTTSDGVGGDIAIDGRPVIALSDTPERTGAVALSRGWHTVTVRVGAPQGSGRRVEAGEIVDRTHRPFDLHRVFPSQVGATRMAIDAVARWIARGLDLTVFSWLAVLVVIGTQKAWREARIGRLLWLAVITEALLFALPYARHVAVLTGGDDWLMYEHLARAIAFGDPLLREPGLGAGQGTPFYVQVLYPYFVALTHLLFGDGIFGVAFVQRLLLGAATGWIAATATRLFGERTGWIALGIGGLLMYAKGGRWAASLLTEPLFTPLLAWWAWLLIRTATEAPRWPRLVLTGVIGGLATLVRSTLFLALPVVLPLWSASVRPRRARATVVLVASLVAVLGMLTLRTWIVSGTFALIPSEGPVTLLIGNTPPRPLAPPPPERRAVYDRFQLPDSGRTFIEYALQAPGEFSLNLWRKALYTVGFFERSGIQALGVAVPDTSWLYVGMWCAAVVGTFRLLRAVTPTRWALVALPGLIALSHFIVVVLFLPNVYGDRLILPLYPLLVPYASFGLEPLVRWAHGRAEGVTAAVLVALALCVFVIGSPRISDVLILLVFGALVLASTTGPRLRFTRHAWLYYGYAAALIVTYVESRRRGSGGDIDVAVAFLLPLAVFAVARLTRARAPHIATLGALTVGAVVAVALLRPPMPGLDIDQLGDIGRDIHSIIAGNPQAPQELANDARDTLSDVFGPMSATFQAIKTQGGALAGLFLLGIWLQALLVSGRAAVRGRSAAAALCCMALLATCVIAVLGVAPSRWGASAYSVAVLAVLFGLAESHAGKTDPHRIDRPNPSGKDTVFS